MTKTKKVFEELYHDILNGKLMPGERLPMERLKQRYSVGFTPLREALFRLSSRGLVKQEEQCGFYIPELSISEFHDLYKLRIYIELHALQLSMKNGDEIWESDVKSTWFKYEKHLDPIQTKKLTPNQWEQIQKEFRFSLIKACKSPWIFHIRDLLYDQSSRYRVLCLQNNHCNEQLRLNCIKENAKLVKSVLERKYDKASYYTKQSWKISFETIIELLKSHEKF